MKSFDEIKNMINEAASDEFEAAAKKAAAKLKKIIGAGAEVRIFDKDVTISWNKTGGYAGDKKISAAIEKASSAGFKSVKHVSSNSPDGGVVGSVKSMEDKYGNVMTYSSSYGQTKDRNMFYIKIKLSEKFINTFKK